MRRPASVGRLSGLILVLAIAGILFSNRGAMTDSLTPVTSPGALSSNDSVPWSQLGPNATTLSSGFNANSTQAIAVTGTLTGPNSLVSVVCPASLCSWASTDVAGFSAGDSVIWTSDAANGGNGPLTLAFNKSVAGVGALIQADGPGQFTAQIQAFNGNTSLGAFTATSDTNGDAVFLGVLDNTAAHITSVLYSLIACTGACTDFAIDTLFINTSGGPTPTATATASSPTATATATVAQPTATATSAVPTATATTAVPTATATVAVPTATATIAPPTATATPVPPTATATSAVPTATATPVPATATPTATPVSGPGTLMVAIPPQINFGNVDASGAGKPRKVSIANKGAVNAIVDAVNVPSTFPIVPGTDLCSNHPIPPRKNCTVMVQFSPSAPGQTSGPLMVTYNGAAPAIVDLSGNGTTVSLKAPASVLLPPAAAGSTGASKPVTITNLSTTASVQMGSANLSRPFTKGSDSCSSALIRPRGKCTIGIEFSAPQGIAPGSTMGGTLDIRFTYGSNSGSVPTVSLIGKVK